VEVLLNWSCYTPAAAGPGEWSDPVLARPEQSLVKTVPADFHPGRVFIWADVLPGDVVSISLLGEGAEQSFRVTSRHAPPRQQAAHRVPLEPPYLTGDEQPLQRAGQGRWRGQAPRFAVHLEGQTITDQGAAPCDLTEDILAKAPDGYQLVIIPPPAKVGKTGSKGKGVSQPANRPDDPFFYLDPSNTFFVEPEWHEYPVEAADQAIVAQAPVWHEFDQPELWAGRTVVPAFPWPVDAPVRPGVVLGDTPFTDPVDVVTRPETVVRFGGRLIGPDGLLTEPPDRLFRTGPHGALTRADLSPRVFPRS
jgi:hypothetical protein